MLICVVINEIANLNPVSYLMEDQTTGDSKRNFGFIAQDVESVLPEVVNTPKQKMIYILSNIHLLSLF
jgi:hypothetical protein